MTNSLKLMANVLLLACVASATLYAQPGRPQTQAQDDRSREARPAPAEPPREEWSVTDHTIQIGGQTIPYKASAGTTLLKNDAGEPTGLLYSVAYTRSDVKDPSTRPIAFLYNGGAGAATMWVLLGALRPARLLAGDGGVTPAPPSQARGDTRSILGRHETLLDKADLVFIDATGTGYSRLAGKPTERDFYGVDEDAASFGRFIATYISRNDRWNSPKFLIGESYGTFRSAVVGNLLQNRYS